MKKKSIVLVAAVLFLSVVFGNTSYAKSTAKKITAIFGSYLVKVSGKKQNTTTLANGSTVYVPINELSKLTNATVKKSGNTYNITPGVPQKNVDEMKFMVNIMNQYQRLDDLGDFIITMSRGFEIAKDSMISNGTRTELDSKLVNYDSVIDEYNDQLKMVNAMQKQAKTKNYSYTSDFAQMNIILNDYYRAFDDLDAAVSSLENYYKTKNDKYIDDFYNNTDSAWDNCYAGKNISSTGYFKLYGKVLKK
ncbi:hypothetical protein [Bacillus sp. FJAT-49736]|uniref:hypothetical protein n=1 Tax=Bacillus sp. FJAT-49736 TaxID=2833582 RepID=UPI001BC9499C|nr:hypothetical protein [Bacillus sp. FJAT-49736]MBS4173463.1 hypothetical protein [Bacillus sp. FJAT-49736]